MKAKKLIEVAMPIKEISAESVRDKSIRHGHISTLHLWWARRPLPACRAIVFASLVPDPMDENCPLAFKDAITYLLSSSSEPLLSRDCNPYEDIPYTSILDPMDNNLRNRLMMFIGKFSDRCQENMKQNKSTSPKEQLTDSSLIKWENKSNSKILKIARELIWIGYNSEKNTTLRFETLHNQFEDAYRKILEAEENLYTYIDRHIASAEVSDLEELLEIAISNFQDNMPSVFDPFSGGGAIPLEAARLGCRSYGNDINPVAHIIEKGSAEFPQKFGKPIIYSKDEFEAKYGNVGIAMASDGNHSVLIDSNSYHISNRLSFDVEYYAKKLIDLTEEKVGHMYPSVSKGEKPIAYYWARTAKCSNPSCGAEVPLLKQFYLCNAPKKKVYLNPETDGNKITFILKKGKCDLKPWNYRGNMTCPCCGNVTTVNAVKEQSNNHKLGERLLAVINDGNGGKSYVLPTEDFIKEVSQDVPKVERPQEYLPLGYLQAFPLCSWGYSRWGEIFSDRQIYMISVWLESFNKIKADLKGDEYGNVIITYLAILIDRISIANTSFGVYHTGRENLERIISRQSISMTFDYPESNPFCGKSGSAENQLDWIIRYIESECSSPFAANFSNASSGEKSQFDKKSLTAVVTDPPYYDAIGYADCSDFFYVWLKRTLGDIYPLTFATPQTPKAEECTAIKHHHNDDIDEAKHHFEHKLTSIFDAIELQTSDVVSIMFAHQSTEAWTTLCNSILAARMNITGSWPMDTEMQGALKTEMAFLESSVTVACRPSERRGFGEFKEVKKDIERKVTEEVEALYELGFRGADLLTACFGQAVSEFGRYKSVEKSDGSEVAVAELLEMARDSAFNALLKGVQGDDFTKFYIGWLQLNGAAETDFDDASKFTRVGVNVNINEIKQKKLLILEGNKMHIAMAEEHIGSGLQEGTRPEDSLISQAHRAILLSREGDRIKILRFVRELASEATAPFWRLLATLKELLPAGDDRNEVVSLLQNAEDYRQNCNKNLEYAQPTLFDLLDN